MKELAYEVFVVYFVRGLDRDVCDDVFCTDVVQYDAVLIVVVSYHMVARVNVYLISYEIVSHECGSQGVHMYMHGEVNLHKLAKEVVEPSL